MNGKCWNKSRGREHNGIGKDEVPRVILMEYESKK